MEGAPKGVLLEETPVLDTIEARRTARRIAGSVIALSLLLLGFLVFRAFFRRPSEERDPADMKLEVVDVQKIRQRNETEAGTMLERAREVAHRGDSELAKSLLNRVAAAYPETRAAGAARDALARPLIQQPLFPDSPEAAEKTRESKSSGAARVGAHVGARPPAAGSSAEAALAGANRPVTAPVPLPLAPNPEAALATKVGMAAGPERGAAAAGVESTPGRTLPNGFQPRKGVGNDPSGWPLEIVSLRDSAIMVLVPGGPFVMGRDGGPTAEGPVHLAKVSTFYIDKHEVTNRQFETFLKETGPRNERTQALAREGGGISISEDFPVVMVNARDARDYAEWAGKRLPTEAQWEKAARGTDHRLYPWGSASPAWHKPRSPFQIEAVMSYPNDLSPYGAYDLAGNALEWTRDWYDANAYASFRGVTADDPTGPTSRPPSLEMTVRGCSRQWLITAREGMQESTRLPYLGFRCVLPVEGPDSVGVFQPAAPGEPAPAPGAGGAAPGGAGNKKTVVPF